MRLTYGETKLIRFRYDEAASRIQAKAINRYK